MLGRALRKRQSIPGSCFSGRVGVFAGLVVTEGLAVTKGPGCLCFFRFLTMIFFFLMTRSWTCCPEVSRVPGGNVPGEGRMSRNPDGKVR